MERSAGQVITADQVIQSRRLEPTRGVSGSVLVVGLPGVSARPATRVLEDEGWVRR